MADKRKQEGTRAREAGEGAAKAVPKEREERASEREGATPTDAKPDYGPPDPDDPQRSGT